MSRKISLPASAHEWAASATIEADPVMMATTDFATAIRAFIASAMMTVSRLSLFWPCSRSAVSAMLVSLPFGGHPLKGRSNGRSSGLPRRHTRWGRMPFAAFAANGTAPLGSAVAHDVEAGARMTGIPRSGGLVRDGHLARGPLHDDGRREALGVTSTFTARDGEPVVLDEHRLPAAVDDRVEDVQLDRIGAVAVGRHRRLGPHRDRGAGPGEERDALERRLDGDPLTAGVQLAGVPVVPVTLGEVDGARGLPLLRHRRDEQVAAEEVLVVEVDDVRVVLVVEDERTLYRLAGLGRPHERGVDVGHQPVAQPHRLTSEVVDLGAERPRVLVDVVDLGVVAAEGSQRTHLHPAHEELGVRVALEAADVGADEGLTREAEAARHRHADPQVVPARLVVAHPVRRIALDARGPGPGQDEGPGLGTSRPEALDRAHRHEQRVLVVVALMLGAALVEEHRLRGDLTGRGLVHVVPDARQTRLDVLGVERAPPRTRLGRREVREGGVARPHLTDVGVAALGPAEDVLREAVVVDRVARVVLDARVDDRDGPEALVRQALEHGRRIWEARRVPCEDAVAVHVVDVEPHAVTRELVVAVALRVALHVRLGVGVA